MTSQSQIDFAQFVAIVKSRLVLIVGISVAAAVLAFTVSSLQADRFEASADLLFHAPEPAPRIDPSEPAPDVSTAPERTAATNLALASLDSVAIRVRDRLDSPLTAEKLRDRVDIAPQGQADIVTITATAGSPAAAARIANAFADEVVAVRRESAQERVQRVIDAIDEQLATAPPRGELAQQLSDRSQQLAVQKRLEAGDAEVAQLALPPRERSAPKPLRNGIIGGALGLILGVIVALVLSRFDRRVHDGDELPDIVGAPVLGRVPLLKNKDWEQQLFLESFQVLRANLQLRHESAQDRTLAVTSTLPGEGKSTVAVKLSEALAASGATVILVDADLRRPRLHTQFGLPNRRGVTTTIHSGAAPVDLLQDTDHPNLRLLAAGPPVATPGALLLGDNGIKELIAKLGGEAEYLVFDTSPVTIGADASGVVAEADATLLVVDLEMAEEKLLLAACEQLHHAEATIAGVVLNRAPVLLKDQAYQSYYRAAIVPDAPASKPASAAKRLVPPAKGPAGRSNGGADGPRPARGRKTSGSSGQS